MRVRDEYRARRDVNTITERAIPRASVKVETIEIDITFPQGLVKTVKSPAGLPRKEGAS